MNLTQHPEIYWVGATAVLTSLLWAPHIIQRIIEMKPYEAFRDPRHDIPTQAPWAQRAIRAHTNAVENLAIFGILVICLVVMENTTSLTAVAAASYFYIRVAHYAVYVLAVPWARTPIFIAGLICLWLLAATLFGVI